MIAVGSGSKKLRHPRLGPVSYSHVVLQVADNPDQTLVTYSPGHPAGVRPIAIPGPAVLDELHPSPGR